MVLPNLLVTLFHLLDKYLLRKKRSTTSSLSEVQCLCKKDITYSVYNPVFAIDIVAPRGNGVRGVFLFTIVRGGQVFETMR